MTSAEPRFFRIAAAMADATRERMLAALLSGEHPIAGALARTLLEHDLTRHWLCPDPDSRALTLTAAGQRELLPLLEADA